jgi:hypothetical protein
MGVSGYLLKKTPPAEILEPSRMSTRRLADVLQNRAAGGATFSATKTSGGRFAEPDDFWISAVVTSSGATLEVNL